MTDTSGPRPDQPTEPLPPDARLDEPAAQDPTQQMPTAPQEPTQQMPAASAGQGPPYEPQAFASQGYPAAAQQGPGYPPAGSAPYPPPRPAGPTFGARVANRPVVAGVIGGLIVAVLAFAAGFGGGFFVGHTVGSHDDDRIMMRIPDGDGPFERFGPGDRGDGNRGDGDRDDRNRGDLPQLAPRGNPDDDTAPSPVPTPN